MTRVREDATDDEQPGDFEQRSGGEQSTAGKDSTTGEQRARRARRFVRDDCRATVEAVLACADAVAEAWDGRTTTDPGAVAGPLRDELEAAGVWTRLPDVLAGAVDAAGCSASASPVADPPYVVATSRGPMLRATVDGERPGTDERRLVVLVRAFAVERDPVRYARGPATPDAAVCATFK